MVLERNIAVRDEVPTCVNNLDKKIVDIAVQDEVPAHVNNLDK